MLYSDRVVDVGGLVEIAELVVTSAIVEVANIVVAMIEPRMLGWVCATICLAL